MSTLRTVRELHTFPCVSLCGMIKTGRKKPAGSIMHSDIRGAQPSQPPDQRTYSAEVTSLNEQSPASSQTAPTQALHNNTIRKLYCQDNFSLFCKNFSHFSCAYCPVIFIPPPALPAYILNVYNKLVSPLSLPGFSPILHFRKFTAIKC